MEELEDAKKKLALRLQDAEEQTEMLWLRLPALTKSKSVWVLNSRMLKFPSIGPTLPLLVWTRNNATSTKSLRESNHMLKSSLPNSKMPNAIHATTRPTSTSLRLTTKKLLNNTMLPSAKTGPWPRKLPNLPTNSQLVENLSTKFPRPRRRQKPKLMSLNPPLKKLKELLNLKRAVSFAFNLS